MAQTVEYIVEGALAGAMLIIGAILALGLASATEGVPKGHPTNRRMGLSVVLLGLSALGTSVTDWVDPGSTLPVFDWAVRILSILLIVCSVLIGLRTTRQMREYKAEE